jgi:hypothetical protein
MSGGRGWLAAAISAIAIAGSTAATRLGPAAPAPAMPGEAASITWLCPHGGGPNWTAMIEVANPGDTAVQAAITSSAGGERRDLGTVDVPAHGEVLREVPAGARDASTRVDLFGGWGAVGWSVWSGGTPSGLGAEPCTSQPGRSWAVVDAVTDRRTHPYLVVMNPFTSDAVIDVALFLSERPPVRSDAWTDLPVDAGTSVALDLSAKRSGALGEPIVGAEVTATVGRVAASSLSVRQGGGIRSVLATPVLSDGWMLPTVGGSGTGTVSVLAPGEAPIRFDTATLSSDTEANAAESPIESRQGGTSASSGDIGTFGPAAVSLSVHEGGPVAAGFRADGQRTDQGATAGAPAPASAWVVLPTAWGIDPRPSLVLVNDGDREVSATLTLLRAGRGAAGGTAHDSLHVSVPAGATLGVPGKFLRGDHGAAVLVDADGPVFALGAGRAGTGDSARYATAMGVPIPGWVASAGP